MTGVLGVEVGVGDLVADELEVRRLVVELEVSELVVELVNDTVLTGPLDDKSVAELNSVMFIVSSKENGN